MLRESDNSMMSIGLVLRAGSGGLSGQKPLFRATDVQQTGISTEIDHVFVQSELSGKSKQVKAQPESDRRTTLTSDQWDFLERGLRQRFSAVAACMDEIVRSGKTPAFLSRCSFLMSQLSMLMAPLQGTSRNDCAWAWLASTDIHMAPDGEFTVFDHNFSLPTGLDRLSGAVAPDDLTRLLRPGSTRQVGEKIDSETVVLDPGFYSATFRGNEFLARCLNAHIARRSDLTIRPDGVFLQVGSRQVRITTIVRRVDDDLLDPNCYRPDSLVGLPGLVRAWKDGLVNVVSPPGSSCANSRSFGKRLPQMIVEFLGEKPLLKSAEVLELSDPDDLRHVLKNAERYAVRTNDPLHPSRPFFGDTGTTADFSEVLGRIRTKAAAYVARPLLDAPSGSGVNLRLYATLRDRFRLLRAAIGRKCQSDGGAPLMISADSDIVTVT